MRLENWRVLGFSSDMICSRQSITGEEAICDYFISQSGNEALYGGDDAAVVKEWRDFASTVTK